MVMLGHDEDDSGNCSGLSGHCSLGLNGACLHELIDFMVLKVLFEIVPVESRDLRRKRL